MSVIQPELLMPVLPIDVFFFDWDSTLTMIEGIDYLACLNGVAQQVQSITQRCMAQTGINVVDYRKRLDFINPTQMQIGQLASAYREQLAPGAREIIQLLQALDKKIYILSGGIKSAIMPLAAELGIHPHCVLAVDLYFNDAGEYLGFNEQSELVQPNGKNREIEKTLKMGEGSLLLGDGISDWEAQTAVTRFIGYAGVRPKTWVQEHSAFYINHTNLLPLLVLSLTKSEQSTLQGDYRSSYEQGLDYIKKGLVLIKEHNRVHHSNS